MAAIRNAVWLTISFNFIMKLLSLMSTGLHTSHLLSWSVGNKERRFGDTTLQRPGKDDPWQRETGNLHSKVPSLRLQTAEPKLRALLNYYSWPWLFFDLPRFTSLPLNNKLMSRVIEEEFYCKLQLGVISSTASTMSRAAALS